MDSGTQKEKIKKKKFFFSTIVDKGDPLVRQIPVFKMEKEKHCGDYRTSPTFEGRFPDTRLGRGLVSISQRGKCCISHSGFLRASTWPSVHRPII